MGLRGLWARWKVVAERIGHFQTRLVLSLVYFVVVAPFALMVRISRDPLGLRRVEGSNWTQKDPVTHELDRARKQF